MNILIAEDEKGMAQILKRGLEEEGHKVRLTEDGHSALAAAVQASFDLILLDVMLPGCSGIEVARRLRSGRCATPILMLTARDAVPDVVRGLDAGADDYLAKPFSFAVLLARIRALGRRAEDSRGQSLQIGDLVVNVVEHRVFRAARELRLTPTEFRLLEFLMRQQGRVASREAILEAVWRFDENVGENTLHAFVRLLRKKVDGGESEKLIQTVRGFGYCVQPAALR
jgi:two-component system, OmpR family, response regulator